MYHARINAKLLETKVVSAERTETVFALEYMFSYYISHITIIIKEYVFQFLSTPDYDKNNRGINIFSICHQTMISILNFKIDTSSFLLKMKKVINEKILECQRVYA